MERVSGAELLCQSDHRQLALPSLEEEKGGEKSTRAAVSFNKGGRRRQKEAASMDPLDNSVPEPGAMRAASQDQESGPTPPVRRRAELRRQQQRKGFWQKVESKT